MSNFLAGLAGTLVGSGVTLLGQYVKHRWETSTSRNRDTKRKALLQQMLSTPGPTGWKKMSTMSGVIGADREETARLLIEIDARASETGSDVWAYLKDKPLPPASE